MPKGNGDAVSQASIIPFDPVRNTVNGERQWGRGNCCVISNLRVACQKRGGWREAMATRQLQRNLKSESCLSGTRRMARGNGGGMEAASPPGSVQASAVPSKHCGAVAEACRLGREGLAGCGTRQLIISRPTGIRSGSANLWLPPGK